MSEFQTSLLIIGAIVVVAVFAYNKWQERRARRAADAAFKSHHADVLLGGTAAVHKPIAEQAEVGRIEPVLAASAPAADQLPAAAAGPAEQPEFAQGAYYIVELTAAEPVSAAALNEHWTGAAHRFARRAGFAALSEQGWESPLPGRSYAKLQAELQLVNRKGVLSESELLEFRSAVETLAARLGASVAAPEMRAALEAARALDAVCAEADIQVAFHIVSASASSFAGTKLRAAADAAGLALDADGRFVLRDDAGRELYCLGDRSGAQFLAASMKDAAPQGLTLTMDVPRTPDFLHTFNAMVRFGRQLSGLLGGHLVDDNGQPLDERAVEAIAEQLRAVRSTLEAHGIAPGSALALRLFS